MPDERPEQLPLLPEHTPKDLQECSGSLLVYRAILYDLTGYLLEHASDKELVEQYCRNCVKAFADDGTDIMAKGAAVAPTSDWHKIAQGIEKARLDFLRILDHLKQAHNL